MMMSTTTASTSSSSSSSSSGEAPRLAATVIICRQAVATAAAASTVDYEVLFVKRHSKARFMPNYHVFPGGTLEVSDFEAEWSNYASHTRHPSGNAFVCELLLLLWRCDERQPAVVE